MRDSDWMLCGNVVTLRLELWSTRRTWRRVIRVDTLSLSEMTRLRRLSRILHREATVTEIPIPHPDPIEHCSEHSIPVDYLIPCTMHVSSVQHLLRAGKNQCVFFQLFRTTRANRTYAVTIAIYNNNDVCFLIATKLNFECLPRNNDAFSKLIS